MWLLDDRKNVNPSPNDVGLTSLIEKVKFVEKEVVVLDCGSKKGIGELYMSVPELEVGTPDSRVSPITPLRR